MKSKIHNFLQDMTDKMQEFIKKLELSPDEESKELNHMSTQEEENKSEDIGDQRESAKKIEMTA